MISGIMAAKPPYASRAAPRRFAPGRGRARRFCAHYGRWEAQARHLAATLAKELRAGCPDAQADVRRLVRMARRGDLLAARLLAMIVDEA